MSFDNQDVLFDILERNKVGEVRACLIFSKCGLESIDVEMTPKSKFPLIYEPVFNPAGQEATVHFIIRSVCEELTYNQSWEELDGDIGFIVTFFTKNQKVIVDELGQ